MAISLIGSSLAEAIAADTGNEKDHVYTLEEVNQLLRGPQKEPRRLAALRAADYTKTLNLIIYWYWLPLLLVKLIRSLPFPSFRSS